jgi:hypothetical protein
MANAGGIAKQTAIGSAGPAILKLAKMLFQQRPLAKVYRLAKLEVLHLKDRQDLSGMQKRDQAAQNVRIALGQVGKTTAQVLINVAIEVAVAELRTLAEQK